MSSSHAGAHVLFPPCPHLQLCSSLFSGASNTPILHEDLNVPFLSKDLIVERAGLSRGPSLTSLISLGVLWSQNSVSGNSGVSQIYPTIPAALGCSVSFWPCGKRSVLSKMEGGAGPRHLPEHLGQRPGDTRAQRVLKQLSVEHRWGAHPRSPLTGI